MQKSNKRIKNAHTTFERERSAEIRVMTKNSSGNTKGQNINKLGLRFTTLK